MEKFNLYYKGILLNKTPLTLEEAQNEQGLIVINYGYKPTICKDSENQTILNK